MAHSRSGRFPTAEWEETQRRLIRDRLDRELGGSVPRLLVCSSDDGGRRRLRELVRIGLAPEKPLFLEDEAQRDVWAAVVDSNVDGTDGVDTAQRIAATSPHCLVIAVCSLYMPSWLARVMKSPGLQPAMEANLEVELPVLLQRHVRQRRGKKAALLHAELGARIGYEFGWEIAAQRGFHGWRHPAPMSDAELRFNQITDALLAAGGNQAEAARLLGWSKSTFHRRVKKYGVPLPSPADSGERIQAVGSGAIKRRWGDF